MSECECVCECEDFFGEGEGERVYVGGWGRWREKLESALHDRCTKAVVVVAVIAVVTSWLHV